ncbi:hypothetical protein ACFQMA_09685 [Halosimplex aquaticum]|uniref:Uncharacterized protein n=1 Tax=Halosimplex aquaticum TaxID=3026162 RepID=A0ABD5XYE0_9EURY|nr:hypothetical protein [Halosimplex aquaticum]
MVFENVTLFEVHLDDAQFGPRDARPDDARGGSDEAARRDADGRGAETGSGADSESTDGTGSGRGRFAKLAVASVVVSVVATVAARRLAGRGADPEFDADGLDDVQPAPSAAETAEETDRVAGPSGARDE